MGNGIHIGLYESLASDCSISGFSYMKSNEHSILRILRQWQIVILCIQNDLYTTDKDTAAGWQTKRKQPMLFYMKLFFWSLFSFWEKKRHAFVLGYFHLISLIFLSCTKGR